MTEPAAEDLRKITEYIAVELREPVTAHRLARRIKEAVMSLAEMPIRYGLVAEEHLAGRGIRVFPVENYLVLYVVSQKDGAVTVIRVLYGRRDWEPLL